MHYSQFLVRQVPPKPDRRFRAHLHVSPEEGSSNPAAGFRAFPWSADPGTAAASARAYVQKHLHEESTNGARIELQLVYEDRS